MSERVVLAIDPGTSKCGLALVRRDADSQIGLIWRKITPVEDLVAVVDEAVAQAKVDLLVVGAGTGSRRIIDSLRENRAGLNILVVDEKDTSLHARERYWEHHKRRGLRRFWPATLQMPPEPFDDFVALILAERVLQV